jgi:hypothetical protein
MHSAWGPVRPSVEGFFFTVETFHKRTVLSSEPEARISLDDDQAMSLIPFVWP